MEVQAADRLGRSIGSYYVGKIFDALLHQHVTTDGSSVRAFVTGNQVFIRGI